MVFGELRFDLIPDDSVLVIEKASNGGIGETVIVGGLFARARLFQVWRRRNAHYASQSRGPHGRPVQI